MDSDSKPVLLIYSATAHLSGIFIVMPIQRDNSKSNKKRAFSCVVMDYYVMMNADWPQFKSPGYLLDILTEGCMVVSLFCGIVLLEE